MTSLARQNGFFLLRYDIPDKGKSLSGGLVSLSFSSLDLSLAL